MNTTLEYGHRVFMVVTSLGKQAFCNIAQLNEVVASLGTHKGYFKIYFFENHKPKRATKALLKIFFEGSQLKQEFHY